MSAVKQKALVFTDLDGTLLDHHDYSFAPVLPLLAQLSELEIPVIANTSKTRDEWLQLRELLHNTDPFVVENGSAIIFPDGEEVLFGETRERILEILAPLRSRYSFEGYSDWSISQIMEKTGLDQTSAEQSASREFSEPLIWTGNDEEMASFCDEIHAAGLNTLQGGRFLHILGRTDKGKALDFLRSKLEQPATIIALGDGPNDIAMLQAADIGIVIASPTRTSLDFQSANRVIHSTQQGPKGWAETMAPLIANFSK